MRLFIALALVAAPMMAADTATGTVNVHIERAPFSISHTEGAAIDFGTITASLAGTDLAIAAAAGDTFTFNKDKNELLQVAPIAGITLHTATPMPNSNIGPLPTVDTFLADFGGKNVTTEYQGTLKVGATIHVAPWTKKGNYTGTYNVTLSYVN